MSLSGLTVWITRPPEQAQRWQQQLTAASADTALIPIMAIEALDSNNALHSIQSISSRLKTFKKIIFISQNAAAYAQQAFGSLPEATELFAIGSATAAALKDWTNNVHTVGNAMNSETLLALPALQTVANDSILICRGEGGRTVIAETLQARGASVESCELYRRGPHPNAKHQFLEVVSQASKLNQHTVISVHSGESLTLLTSLFDQCLAENTVTNALVEQLKRQPLLVPGERVAGIAKQLGFSQIITALNASDPVMTDTLQRWWQQQ